ncbi:MAG TPA: NAD-dependent epimerase/dehydratase family protein [Microthrixaceae bacterium]|nr:NAD-dependent epimerase/dehydratase family protein [Microthrixaceae bacterium]
MGTVLVTGSAGLIGSETVRHFAARGMEVVGVDNNLREYFFGDDGSTLWSRDRLTNELGDSYRHFNIDIRDTDAIDSLVKDLSKDLALVVHCAAQPSHDWAARDPLMDFEVNARGTINMLQAVRNHAIDTPFIFTSTNKVYGDRPNTLPLVELDTRWEIESGHTYEGGIREDMSIDDCLHSVFGASKVAADIMVQEYGRYFDMKTACFRGGTLTGPGHSAAELHGFLAYVMRCAMTGTPYRVFGYGGKQVRDAIHSADLVNAFDAVFEAPRSAAVYNIGGGRHSNCSVIEAIALCEEISGKEMSWSYVEENRIGDHIWWIGDNGRFESDYPEWKLRYDVPAILREIHDSNLERWH